MVMVVMVVIVFVFDNRTVSLRLLIGGFLTYFAFISTMF